MERKADKLGRIVIPKEMFDAWGIDSKENPMMCIDDFVTHVKVYPKIARCTFCGIMLPPPYALEHTNHYKGRAICPQCQETIALEYEARQQGGKVIVPTLIIPQGDYNVKAVNLQDKAQ